MNTQLTNESIVLEHFQPDENFFLDGFVCWRHERAQKEYEARSRNWIWLDKFTSFYKIKWKDCLSCTRYKRNNQMKGQLKLRAIQT